MNLTWHIVKKDCRRLRWPLAFWAALMIGQFILGLMMLRQVDAEAEVLGRTLQLFDGLHVILWSLQLFLGYMLVVAFLYEDPLVGPQTWWVTRPISGGRLLVAKVIAIVLCLWLLPIVVNLPWWLDRGYDFREIGLAAAQMTLGQAVLTVFAFGFGVLTANFSRFVVVNLVVGFAWFCCGLTLLSNSPKVPTGVILTRFWLALAVALVALALIGGHQFLTRRTGRSWAILAAGFVLTLLVIRFASADWATTFLWRPTEPAALGPVTFKVEQVDFTDNGRVVPDDESIVGVRIGSRYANAPEGYGFGGGQFTGTLRWPDGLSVERSGWVNTYLGPVAWRLMGILAPPVLESGRSQDLSRAPGALASALLPRSIVAKLRREPPTWDARMTLFAFRGEVVAEVPLKEGAHGGRSGHRINLLGIEHRKGGLSVSIAESEPVLALDLFPGFYNLAFGRQPGLPNMFYALCSRDRTKYLFLTENRMLYTQVSTVAVARRTIEFTAQQLADPAQPNWLDDAVLVKVAFRRVGTVIRNMHSDALMESEYSRKKATSPRIKAREGSP